MTAMTAAITMRTVESVPPELLGSVADGGGEVTGVTVVEAEVVKSELLCTITGDLLDVALV